MQEPVAYLNGSWVPARELAVPIDDAGFVLGTTVTEQLRTFGGEVFRVEDHLRRLEHSLEIVGIDYGLTLDELTGIVLRAASQNRALIDQGDDLGVGIFVTPGSYPTLSGYAGGGTSPGRGPLVCAHTYPLQFGLWAKLFDRGQPVVVSTVEQISPRSWPPELKCRSRMHYYLADRAAAQSRPGARAILLDADGTVSEATTANLVLYRAGRGLVSPRSERILPGVSLGVLRELAAQLEIPFEEQDLRPEDLIEADELLLTSTSVCVLPAISVDGRNVGTGRPGPVFQRLLAAWSERVGLDIAAQAARFGTR